MASASEFTLSKVEGRYPLPSFPSNTDLYRSACAPNSLPLNLFADPHPLTPVASIFYKNGRGEGVPSPRAARPNAAQSWCNVSPLDATLLSQLLCVANKELAQYLSLLDATLTKNIGGALWHSESWL